MTAATVRGAGIRYEVVGDEGPWLVLTPGGRSGLESAQALAGKIAVAGYRALIYDRPNCGASDVLISDDAWEDEIGAADVAELLRQLNATPAIAVAQAGGNRVNFFLALHHPEVLRGVIFCWPSGRQRAAEILAQDYYGQFAEAAQQGGMSAVCDTPYYQERIERNAGNRERLLAMDPGAFIAAMERWRQGFLDSAEWPAIAVTEEQLRSINLPVCVIPGLTDDPIHGRETSEQVARLIPGAQVRYIPDERRPDDAERSWLREALQRRGQSAELPQAILAFAAEAAKR
jgi:pimeloyl-ACP methyl ester carboxylesterase